MNKIYTFWWQGFDNAPDIVKICHRSLRENLLSETQELIVLDKDNLSGYVRLPAYVMDKFERGKITATHFSDMVRMLLLGQTGGFWTDATVLFTKPLDDDIFRRDFFGIKYPAARQKDITAKWASFFLGGKPDFPLFHFMTDFWYEYWKQEDELIDYLLISHLFFIAWRENKRVREALERCSSFHYRADYFQRLLNRPYSEEQYQEIIRNEPYIKLSYKFPLTTKAKGKNTFYGHLRKAYLS